MSTLRQDPTTRQWVILAPRRAARPHEPVELPRSTLPERDEQCPFCPGNEDQTPPEVLRLPDDGAWRVRVVPNLYSALGGDGPAPRGGAGPFREMPGVGGHEVVIETPHHDARPDEMSLREVTDVLRVWRRRYLQLLARPGIRAAVAFKNFGRLAGTSLVHPHSQILATPVLLPRMQQRLEVATRYFDENGRCVYDEVLDAERAAGTRVIAEGERFLAFEPFASQTPFETWIAPTTHRSSFGDIDDGETRDLARVLRRVLAALRRAAGDPDYNLVVFSAPPSESDEDAFHWTLRVLPRLSTPAGFEVGSGMSINTVAPEDAALALREAARTE
ncbi:MAG: galactose-1-phosphate uridylyltransferase [Actinobacteria bacterium]|nr:galactose-1-phosphate uridylyltransferase [Actinomycetota bacterium]